MTQINDTNDAPRLGGTRNETSPRLGGEAALKHIIEMMYSEDEETRKQAVDRLEEIGSERACDLLMEALDDESYSVRNRAVVALGYLGNPRATEKLVPLFDTTEKIEYDVCHGPTGEWRTHSGERFRVDLMTLVEAVGRIGDPRGLYGLTMETRERLGSTFHVPIRISWAIASIAGRTDDLEVKRQAARQLIRIFPTYEFANKYILHRMPWPKTDMLDTVAFLLNDHDAETRYYAAIFLSEYDDPRGAEMLLQYLHQPEFTDDFSEFHASEALATIGDRRVLDVFLEMLGQPNPSLYVSRSLHMLLERWGETLTSAQREQLTEAVPKMIAHLDSNDLILTDIVEGIRLIDTERAHQFVDDWIARKIHELFESFIERGDPSGVPDNLSAFSMISRSHAHALDAGILAHPLMRQYAFPALRARIQYLRERSEEDQLDTLFAVIGWVGDPRALPFLIEELVRVEQDDPEHLFGEIISAIGNLHLPESVPVLVSRLQDGSWHEHYAVVKALRFYINKIPDQRAILALLELHTAGELFDFEVIEAIGRTGCPAAVPGLASLLARDNNDDRAEVINALAEIATRNRENTGLVCDIVSRLVPMLDIRRRARLNCFYQPLDSMPIDAFTAIVLEDIGTPEALGAVARWRGRNEP